VAILWGAVAGLAAAGAVAAVVAAGCVDVNGGAVEIEWLVRSSDGRAIGSCGCADPAIARVRFSIVSLAGGADWCDTHAGVCTFSCERQTGATPFAVTPGRYALSIVPLDAQGQDLRVATTERTRVAVVPAPILRDVSFGQPTHLPALLISARCADRCSGSNPQSACK
jgi:hypothetical protein